MNRPGKNRNCNGETACRKNGKVVNMILIRFRELFIFVV